MSMNTIFDKKDDIRDIRQKISDFVDPEPGVHYLIYNAFAWDRNEINGPSSGLLRTRSSMGGITPRLNSDGSIMVDSKFTLQLKPQLNPDDSRFCE